MTAALSGVIRGFVVGEPRPPRSDAQSCTAALTIERLVALKKQQAGSAITAALIRSSCVRGCAWNSFLRISAQAEAADDPWHKSVAQAGLAPISTKPGKPTDEKTNKPTPSAS